jgi:glycosyltransferase involved in cell wall biosynthesis
MPNRPVAGVRPGIGSIADVRLLWVTPRFGNTTVGGAERLVGELATRATPESWTSEVATTCAVDHYTWANELEPGTRTEDGIPVHRFEVGPRDGLRYEQLHPSILSGNAGYDDELEWLANSIWSPALQDFLEKRGADYDLTLFAPYFFGTTVWGAQVAPERSALVPCLHDEPYARLATIRRLLESVRGCVFNSEAEDRLARSITSVREAGVVGMGFDPPDKPPTTSFAQTLGLGSYLIYAGRIEEGKRVHVAVEYALRHAHERPDAPRLVLIGSGTYEPPEEAANVVVRAGLLDDEERRAAYADALALVNPSHMESFSIVLMEAWLEGTPVLVAEGSEVLREHVEHSGGGLTFDSYESYRDAVDRLVDDPTIRQDLGARGREYVHESYSWPCVRRRLQETLERVAG